MTPLRTAAAAAPHAASTTPGKEEPSNASPRYSTPSANRSTPATTATVSDDHTPAPTQRTARTTQLQATRISPHCVPNGTPTETNSPRDLRAVNRRHLMTSEPPPVIHDGDCVTIQGEALVLCYRACLALVMRQHRDGVASPPLLHDLRAVLYRAVMSAPGHEIDTGAATLSCCGCRDGADPISVADAAKILEVIDAAGSEAGCRERGTRGPSHRSNLDA